jgi:hypothetical protein
MENLSAVLIFAIVTIIGSVAVFAIDIFPSSNHAVAQRFVGCPVNGSETDPAPPAFGHSQGRCLHLTP